MQHGELLHDQSSIERGQHLIDLYRELDLAYQKPSNPRYDEDFADEIIYSDDLAEIQVSLYSFIFQSIYKPIAVEINSEHELRNVTALGPHSKPQVLTREIGGYIFNSEYDYDKGLVISRTLHPPRRDYHVRFAFDAGGDCALRIAIGE